MPRILIIDDEPLVRAVLRSILERHGYTVMEAPDGRAGLALWRHTPSDLVLTDIFMPQLDGIEVIRQLTHLWPQAKIIAMTGGSKIGDFKSSVADAALQLGAQHLLLKPFTKETLLAVISAVLNPQEDSRTTSLDQTHLVLSRGVL
jgi:two-component system response regulator (stage 0 sporulation protein F)